MCTILFKSNMNFYNIQLSRLDLSDLSVQDLYLAYYAVPNVFVQYLILLLIHQVESHEMAYST